MTTKAERRVEIAKDVLKMIRAKRIVVESGYGYVCVEQAIPGTAETGLKELLAEAPPCTVCAKGALFVAKLDKKNKLQLGDVSSSDEFYGLDHDKTCEYLVSDFTQPQLDLIEAAFE